MKKLLVRIKSAPRHWLGRVIFEELTAHQKRSWDQFERFYNQKALTLTPGVSAWMSGIVREEIYSLVEEFSKQHPNLAPSLLGKAHLLRKP